MSTQTEELKGSFVGTASASVEAARGLLCGVLFGATSPLIGQPMDRVKTLMQCEPHYQRMSAIQAAKHVVKTEGFLALYKGLLPPLLGSSIYVRAGADMTRSAAVGCSHIHGPAACWASSYCSAGMLHPALWMCSLLCTLPYTPLPHALIWPANTALCAILWLHVCICFVARF